MEGTGPHEQQRHGAHGAPTHEGKEPVNLRRAYPIAFRSIIRRSIHWLLGFLILIILLTAIDWIRPTTGTMAESVFFMLGTTLFFIGLTLLAAKLVYELLYYHVYYYGTELEHLVISRGLFFKTRASFPLARMADVYVNRTPIDLLFGLYNLRITTPSPVAEHGAIDGLGRKRAIDLQNYLLALVNTTVAPVDEQAATDTLRALKATEEPTVLDPSPERSDPKRSKPQTLPDELESDRAGATKNAEHHRRSGKSEAESDDESLVDPEEVFAELQRTKRELKKTRKELIHVETVLDHAQEALERTQEAEPGAHDSAHTGHGK